MSKIPCVYLMGYIGTHAIVGVFASFTSWREVGAPPLFALTALVAVLLILDLLTGGAVRSFVRSTVAGVWIRTEAARTAITNTGYFSTRRSLAQENAALREQVAQYREKAAAHDALLAENAQLRDALSLAARGSGMTVPVVSSFKSSPYGSFLIGAGVKDPIAEGDLVVTQGGFVVGVVRDVQQNTAAVRGVFAPGEATDALVGSTALVVTGEGGGNARANVPRGIEVREGEPVIAPVFGGRPIGIVGRVEASPTSPDQQLYIRLPVNMTSLRYVFVIHESR